MPVLIGVPTGSVATLLFMSESPSGSVQPQFAGWLDPRGYVPPSTGTLIVTTGGFPSM